MKPSVEYAALSSAELRARLEEELGMARRAMSRSTDGAGKVMQMRGWSRAHGNDAVHPEYLLRLLEDAKGIHNKVTERIEQVLRESSDKIESYHVARLLEVARDAADIRKDFHSYVLQLRIEPFTELEEYLGQCEAELGYETLQALAFRLEEEVGKPLVSAQSAESKGSKAGVRIGRPFESKYESGHIFYEDKSAIIPPNTRVERVCSAVFRLTKGKTKDRWIIDWAQLYEEAEEEELLDNKEKVKMQKKSIDNAVDDLNTITRNAGMGALLKRERGRIRRLF